MAQAGCMMLSKNELDKIKVENTFLNASIHRLKKTLKNPDDTLTVESLYRQIRNFLASYKSTQIKLRKIKSRYKKNRSRQTFMILRGIDEVEPIEKELAQLEGRLRELPKRAQSEKDRILSRKTIWEWDDR
jgi:hypothetical protein